MPSRKRMCAYFLPLLINQNIIATITTTMTTPTHTPALKIPAIASQLLRVNATTNNATAALVKLDLFILYSLRFKLISLYIFLIGVPDKQILLFQNILSV